MTLPVLNYSFVRDFKNCPHKAFRRYVLKDIKFESTSKMDEGRKDHDALANRLKRGMALGLELRQGIDMKDPKVQAVLFNQRARAS